MKGLREIIVFQMSDSSIITKTFDDQTCIDSKDFKESTWRKKIPGRVKLPLHPSTSKGRVGKSVWHGRGSLTGSTTRQWPVRMAARRCQGYENEKKREREEKTFGNLLDLAQRIDICSWNVLEAKEKYSFRGER